MKVYHFLKTPGIVVGIFLLLMAVDACSKEVPWANVKFDGSSVERFMENTKEIEGLQ